MKRIFSLFVAVATALSMGIISTSAMTAGQENFEKAVNPPGLELYWVNTASIEQNISFSGNTATCTGVIRGNANVNSITATFTLRRVNSNGTLTTLKTWNSSSNSRTLNFSGTYSTVTKGETYRLSVSAVVTTSGGSSENVSDSFTKTY